MCAATSERRRRARAPRRRLRPHRLRLRRRGRRRVGQASARICRQTTTAERTRRLVLVVLRATRAAVAGASLAAAAVPTRAGLARPSLPRALLLHHRREPPPPPQPPPPAARHALRTVLTLRLASVVDAIADALRTDPTARVAVVVGAVVVGRRVRIDSSSRSSDSCLQMWGTRGVRCGFTWWAAKRFGLRFVPLRPSAGGGAAERGGASGRNRQTPASVSLFPVLRLFSRAAAACEQRAPAHGAGACGGRPSEWRVTAWHSPPSRLGRKASLSAAICSALRGRSTDGEVPTGVRHAAASRLQVSHRRAPPTAALLTWTTATSASSSSALTAAAGIDARATPTASAVVARPASARTSWTTAPVVARSGA